MNGYKRILFYIMLFVSILMCSSCEESKKIDFNVIDLSGTYVIDEECFFNINEFHIGEHYIEEIKICLSNPIMLEKTESKSIRYQKNVHICNDIKYDLELYIKFTNLDLMKVHVIGIRSTDWLGYNIYDALFINGTERIIFRFCLSETLSYGNSISICGTEPMEKNHPWYGDKIIENSGVTHVGCLKIEGETR